MRRPTLLGWRNDDARVEVGATLLSAGNRDAHMKWKYYFIHEWPEGHLFECAEALLLPDDSCYDGSALRVTIYGLRKDSDDVDPDDQEWRAKVNALIGERAYWVNDRDDMGDTNLVFKGPPMSQADFLKWARFYLELQGLRCTELVDAPIGEFEGRSSMADMIAGLQRMAKDEASES